MFSMVGASLFLPFLPLLPKQILLTNLMTDFPEITIATDNVDGDMVEQPRRWDTRFIRNFMMTFGLVSSVFDYATFGELLLLGATVDRFRTGWFLESIISACLIVLVVRTRKPFFMSRPGHHLLVATVLVVVAALVLPYTPLARVFGFTPLPLWYLAVLGAIVTLYIVAAEMTKRIFYRRAGTARSNTMLLHPSPPACSG
jgi:Mg2+-importing ATPase